MTSAPWVLIPTAQRDHVRDQLAKWRGRGWKIGLLIDYENKTRRAIFEGDYNFLAISENYPGVWSAWNALARAAVAIGAEVVCLAGDDMDPPLQPADEIARMYLERFPSGLGVLQGTGDKQGQAIDGKWNSARICGSPIIGREWVKRAYRGNGPVDARYGSFYADEDLMHVATKLGVLWQEESVNIFHRHWSFRGGFPREDYHERNQRADWARDKALFDESLALGFPEGELL